MDNGQESRTFQVTNGIKQGCVLAPMLFSIMFTALFSDPFRSIQSGIQMQYKTDGKLFNLHCLQAITNVKVSVLQNFLFADDCALNASPEYDMQINMNQLSRACGNFGLTISTKKTKVMYQPAPGKLYRPSQIVNDQSLQAITRFTYLDSTLSNAVNIDDEINNRLVKASAAFGRLMKNVWQRRGISTKRELKVYRAVILTTLMYGSETWAVNKIHANKLQHFQTKHLRQIMGIKWQVRVPDNEVLQRAEMFSTYVLL
eukprot:gene6896-12505_t